MPIPTPVYDKLSDANSFILTLACDGDEFGFTPDEMDKFNSIYDTIADILASHGLAELKAILDDVACA